MISFGFQALIFFSGYLFQYNEECYKILKTKNIVPLNKVF